MQIDLVTCEDGDWEGIYYNGRLVEQGHSVPVWMFLEKLAKAGVLKFHRRTLTNEKMEELGSLPDKMSDIDV